MNGNVDLYSRRKQFPNGTKQWRHRLVRSVLRGERKFAVLRENADTSRIRDVLDDVVKTLFLVNEILLITHGTPDFGHLPDPLDELIFIILSQRTRIKTANKLFTVLKDRFPRWEDVLDVPDTELRDVVEFGGRGQLRTKAIRGILQTLMTETGELSLECLREMAPEEAFRFLRDLPGVGEKTARCVLMFSLGLGAFPTDAHIIRIFRRMRLLDSLIGSLEGVEHRKAQEAIAPLIPPDIAYTLHVNMVTHGQEVCKERTPACNGCEIRKFCEYFRQARAKEAASREMTFVDLFCGAGGLSLGFETEGFRVVLAADNDLEAIRSYRLNHVTVPKDLVWKGDITELSDTDMKQLVPGRVDVLVAGVPCQGFSRVGYRTKPALMERKRYSPEKDEKNRLFLEVIRLARVLHPRIILLENVPDMGKAKVREGNGVKEVVDLLRQGLPNYRATTISLDASGYGIPQRRTRLFFMAFRGSELPDVEESLERHKRELWQEVSLPFSLAEAIGDLPALTQGEGKQVRSVAGGGGTAENPYMDFVRDQEKVLYNHQARSHNEDDMRIVRALREGENYVSLLKRRPEVIKERAHKVYSTDNFHDKFYRMPADGPSRTITAHLARDGNSFILPSQDRSLTVREAARLQSFPDDWIFTGSRYAQFTQVGNAVPPLLARVIARFFKHLLEGDDGSQDER